MPKNDCRCGTWKTTRASLFAKEGEYAKECHGPDGRQCAKAAITHESWVGQHTQGVSYFIAVWAVASGKRSFDYSGPMAFKTVSDAKEEADKMLTRVRADVGFSGLRRTRRGCACGRKRR